MSAFDPKRTSGGALAKCRSCWGSLSVNAQMVVPKRPGRFYGVRCQFLVPILCFVWVCSLEAPGVQHVSLRVSDCRSDSALTGGTVFCSRCEAENGDLPVRCGPATTAR